MNWKKARNRGRNKQTRNTWQVIHKKKMLKACAYRVYSSFITFLISLVLTGHLLVSLSIGVLDSVVKIFSYYFFEVLWSQYTGLNAKPAVIFLTGLSGSGKTTIARALVQKLQQKGVVPVMLDGDEIRNAIRQTGFDEQSRKNHNLNVGYMASLLEAQGNFVIVSLISPYEDTRHTIRGMCRNFKEVYVATALEVCIERDTKGLYGKAIRGEIQEFTGISAPYQPPQNPEVVIDTASLSVQESVHKILKALK